MVPVRRRSESVGQPDEVAARGGMIDKFDERTATTDNFEDAARTAARQELWEEAGLQAETGVPGTATDLRRETEPLELRDSS